MADKFLLVITSTSQNDYFPVGTVKYRSSRNSFVREEPDTSDLADKCGADRFMAEAMIHAHPYWVASVVAVDSTEKLDGTP
jgi:hypothetical protein